jgi:Ataxin-3
LKDLLGYSVFAVTQIDPLAPLALPRTKADELASEIPEITNASTRISTSRSAVAGTSKSSRNPRTWESAEGLEDEDMALQAALFASVMGESSQPATTPLPTRPPIHETVSDPWEIRNARPAFSHPSSVAAGSTPVVDDSLEATARRAREDLARFQEEQRHALAEQLESDEMISNVLGRRQGAATVTSPPRRRAPRPRREDEEEEEMMRRAIEASKKEAEERGEPEEEDDDHEISFEEDDDMDLDDNEEEEAELERLMQQRRDNRREEEERDRMRSAVRSTSPGSYPLTSAELMDDILDPFGAGLLGQNAAHLDNRIYDDEDAELQAALKASLEGAPADILIPPPPPPAARAPTVGDSSKVGGNNVTTVANGDGEEEESEEEEEEEVPQPVKLTAEEMRKARLARFGG